MNAFARSFKAGSLPSGVLTHVTIHFTLLPILYGLRGRVACEAHHSRLLLAPSIRWDLAATIWAHTMVCISCRVWVAHISRIICAQNGTTSRLFYKCAHRLYTLATTHRAFTMGVNKPYSSCFTFKHSKHAALSELVFILCSVNPTPTSDSVERGFQSPL